MNAKSLKFAGIGVELPSGLFIENLKEEV